QTQKRTLATVVTTTITSTASSSSSSSLSQPAVASRLIKSKTRVSVAKKRGRISENEENDENNNDTSVLHE
ncbi:unnamed protein product, partial [Rotaria sp. Silwood2]